MSYFCGCYYYLATAHFQRQYLPLLNSEVHSTILSTTSRTTLKQTFTNPSSTDAIKECTYTFPLYDGVSVVSFTCRIGKKVLTGLVKEKAKAKEIFDQAVARGETAGLLQQAPEASDIFSTKLGNIPAGQSVIVEVTYIGELKHHETEGIRFTIPTKIAPRYGAGPSHGFSTPGPFSTGGDNGEINIVVDVNMPDGSFIKSVQSPSHPIAVSMGTVSTSVNDEPTMSKASATLSLGSAALEKDFVLIVQSKDVGIPKAILETHPTISNQRALMATLVPKFSLPPSRCEIVFVADRSGSMQNNIEMLVSAMKVFLKSLPQSVQFNICSFGSRHSFLWKKSQSSSRETVNEAISHLQSFSADMGGTETFGAIKSTVERRLIDIPLEIILLTDGDIHRQNELFEYVNQQVEATKGNVRVFPLGIGNGVSHSLIEGLARAGNGFAQAVQIGERLDNAVVRMLRGALSPHITDYTLEVKYETNISDDYELIDRVTDSMKVLLTDDTRSLKSSASTSPKPAISLFDSNMKLEKDVQDATFILPSVPSPKLLQAPHKIPTLFAFSRTTVYLLMSPETIQRKPIAVILRAISEHGPLALEIPVEILSSPAETIHQLAAKKAVQDFEEGRGWIYDAKDQNDVLVREKYPSYFDDMVQREAVRLGEKFQIAGKWCSFVAVAANDKEIEEKKQKMAAAKMAERNLHNDKAIEFSISGDEFEELDSESFDFLSFASPSELDIGSHVVPQSAMFDAAPAVIPSGNAGGLFGAKAPNPRLYKRVAPSSNAMFGSSSVRGRGNGVFGSSQSNPRGRLFGGLADTNQGDRGGLFGSSATPPPPPPYQQATGFGPQHVSSGPMYSPMSSARSSSSFQPQPPPQPIQMAQQMQQQQRAQQGSSAHFESSKSPSNAFSFGSLFSTASPQSRNPGPSMTTPMGGAMVALMGKKMMPEARRQSSAMPKPQIAAASVMSSGSSMFRKRKSLRRMSSQGSTGKSAEVDDLMDFDVAPSVINWSTKSTTDKVLALIDLQDFEGWWPVTPSEITEISKITGVKIEETKNENEAKMFVTMLVIKFLEQKCVDEEGTWGLVVEKGRGWLQGLGLGDTKLQTLEQTVGKLVA